MESEKQFFPKPEKPPVLYHASSSKDIERFEPRIGKQRDETEGAQIFATPSKAMATIFMVDADDSWTHSGTIDDVPYLIVSDRERFESLDNGGCIYSLPSDSFNTDIDKGLGDLEYTSTESVTPIERESFPSALEVMIRNGVKVYFVDSDTWQAIEESDDHGKQIMDSLTPESL